MGSAAEAEKRPDFTRARYDHVPYQDEVFENLDVSRLLGMAKLLGLGPGDTRDLRVLDLGCASGRHICAQAARYPGVAFTGVDFSAAELANARARVEEQGLSQVELIQGDFREVEVEEGAYDLVLCHGTFSWVPDDAKQRIFELGHHALKPTGLAAIVYLTYPGWKQREAIRELLAMRVAEIDDPEAQVRDSALLLRVLQAGYSARPDDAHARSLLEIVESIQASSSNVFIHDELGRDHDPCYFLQFAEWADECGLQYVSEVDLKSMATSLLPETTAPILGQLDPDFLETQQLIDFLVNRGGRASLLARKETLHLRRLCKESLAGLAFRVPRLGGGALESEGTDCVRFDSVHGDGVSVHGRAAVRLVQRLSETPDRPQPYSVVEAALKDEGVGSEALVPLLMDLLRGGAIDPHFPLARLG